MKKLTFLLAGFLALGSLKAQVGINTETPKATLDVEGEPGATDKADGLMPPRITGDELATKTAYGADQKGAVVYVTEGASTFSGQTVNVTSPGIYYFDGTVWVGIVNNENKVAGKCVNEPFAQGPNGSTITVGDYSFQWVTTGTGSQSQYYQNQIQIRRNIPGTTYIISKPLGGNGFEVGNDFSELTSGNWTRIGDEINVNTEEFGAILLHSEDNRVFRITASGIRRQGNGSDAKFCYTVEQLN